MPIDGIAVYIASPIHDGSGLQIMQGKFERLQASVVDWKSHFGSTQPLTLWGGAARALVYGLVGMGAITGGRAIAQDAQLSVVELTDEISVITGAGGNIAVVEGDTGLFLVDDGLTPVTDQVALLLAEIEDAPVRFVINTHWHFDHTGGNEGIGNRRTVIVAHENVRERMSMPQFIGTLGMEIEASSPEALPVITFTDSLTFHLGQTIEVRHVPPAHTDGDSIVWFPDSNVVHMGDIYFNGAYPFVDIDSGGSLEGVIAAVAGVLERTDDATQIIPGHGPVSNQAELGVYLEVLTTVRDRTQAAIEEGLTIQEFIDSDPTAELDGDWGNGFMAPAMFLEIMYLDLAS